ncbi:MAG: hypothetical protein WB439_13030 [Acidobacteriaceae bacterium]
MLFLIWRLKRCGRNVARKIPSVNHGGCAVYAAMVASALERAGVSAWGVVMGPPSGDLDRVRQNGAPGSVQGWNRQGVFFTHILVQFEFRGEVWTHDVGHTLTRFEQQCTAPEHRLLPGRLTVQELRLLAARLRRLEWLLLSCAWDPDHPRAYPSLPDSLIEPYGYGSRLARYCACCRMPRMNGVGSVAGAVQSAMLG